MFVSFCLKTFSIIFGKFFTIFTTVFRQLPFVYYVCTCNWPDGVKTLFFKSEKPIRWFQPCSLPSLLEKVFSKSIRYSNKLSKSQFPLQVLKALSSSANKPMLPLFKFCGKFLKDSWVQKSWTPSWHIHPMSDDILCHLHVYFGVWNNWFILNQVPWCCLVVSKKLMFTKFFIKRFDVCVSKFSMFSYTDVVDTTICICMKLKVSWHFLI